MSNNSKLEDNTNVIPINNMTMHAENNDGTINQLQHKPNSLADDIATLSNKDQRLRLKNR